MHVSEKTSTLLPGVFYAVNYHVSEKAPSTHKITSFLLKEIAIIVNCTYNFGYYTVYLASSWRAS